MKTREHENKGKHVLNPPPITLSGTNIEYAEAFTSLGVLFTPTMSWDAHISKLCVTISSFIGLTSRYKYILPVRTKLSLYYAFFYSYINYCFLVWGNTTTSNTQKLFILQKKMIRAIANVPYDTPTRPTRLQYKIVPVDKMFEYRFTCFYKRAITRNDPFLSRIVELLRNQTSYEIRKTNTFVLPKCRTNYGMVMLKYILQKCLNTVFYDNLNTMSFLAIRNTFI